MRIRHSLFGLALIVTCAVQAQTPGPSAPAAAPANPRGTPTTMVVKFRVKAGKNAEFEKAFREMQDGVRAHEPGNVYYDFFVDSNDPQLYVIVERYKDADAVAAHGKSEHAKKMIATIRDLMDGPIEAERLILISAKQ
ncbi:MAG TPA: putative quinol monooxygenase [Steroidobacteraceae bacterium]|nr:putative quinol monooxygenase [Steroidobacteraceae bacterium]